MQEVMPQQLLLLLCLSLGVIGQSSPGGAACPERAKGLVPWRPGHDASLRADIGPGKALLLVASASFHSVHVHGGGKLVIADRRDEAIVVRTRSILIEDGGELHVGSEDCPYLGSLTISLYSRSDEVTEEAHPYFGLKFVGVGHGGTLEVHGAPKLSWTFLNGTVHPPPPGEEEAAAAADGSRGRSDSAAVKSYRLEQSWGYRGIVVHVLDHNTGAVLSVDRFDTFKSRAESRRLASHLDSLASGRVVSMVVNDDCGSRSLDATARVAVQRLGGRSVGRLAFRQPWAFVAVKGDPSSAVESQGSTAGTTGRTTAEAAKLFRTAAGDLYTVSTLSEWTQDVEWTDWFNRDDQGGTGDWENLSTLRSENPGAICAHPLDIQVTTLDGLPAELTLQGFHRSNRAYGFACRNQDQQGGRCQNYRVRFLCGRKARPSVRVTVEPLSNATVLTLAEDARSWRAGDRVVVASTDFSMHQAEEFTLLPCPECATNQVKVEGKPRFTHVGEVVDGVDMRAEVGLLTRNVVVQGEMEPSCYGDNACRFFSFDTFGGHIKMAAGFKACHLEGAELRHMGQQTMGHYPVHFHVAGDLDQLGGYDPPTYVRGLSIHHSFSRCLTIHGSSGLLVKDVVGYDVLGHCFFTEDGPEERNTFDHCLGLVVRASSLLPSDRDVRMCRTIRQDAYPGYVPRPRHDCTAVSTFWLANPNNNIINCSAAGSEEGGFWFVFHHVPTGPSEGKYAPGYTEHKPFGIFADNRAHSNYRAGMMLDHGVKTTNASERDKRPYLSLVSARYGPHVDADPFKPRVPALITGFVAFRNQEHGAWLRGGDVWLRHCQFADNGIGLTLASGGTFPDDDGSRQEVVDSLFVGESHNRGSRGGGGGDEFWGPGSLDHRGRTLPRGITFPVRGLQVYDGPLRVERVTFRRFAALADRHASAIGFRLNNAWQSCPNNNLSGIVFQDVPADSRVFFGEPGPWFRDMSMDGDKTTVFRDGDGSVSGFPGAFLVKHDDALLRHPDCVDVPEWRAAVCSARYAQVYIQARSPSDGRLSLVRDEFPGQALTLEGALARGLHYQQYQPVLMLSKGYTAHWDTRAPHELTVWLINFNLNDWVRIGFCYPRGTTFSVLTDVHDRLRRTTQRTGTLARVASLQRLEHPPRGAHASPSSSTTGFYFFDEDTGLLFLRLQAQAPREGDAFCSTRGCERVKVKASLPAGAGAAAADCRARAYPKYAEPPTVDVPMPKRRPSIYANSWPGNFVEVQVESANSWHPSPKHNYATTTVNGQAYYQLEDGLQVISLNGSTGTLVSRRVFKASQLRSIPTFLLYHLTHNVPDGSVVLVTSKGKFVTEDGKWKKALATIGVEAGAKYLDKMVLVGFKGGFRPDWVKFASSKHHAKIHQLVSVPVLRKFSTAYSVAEPL
ncbi:cell migration-inducing and hyaluronan-binding protein-like [Lampetra fluviatilis]